MEEKHIQELIEKVLSGQATDQDKHQISKWYESRIQDQQIWKSELADEESVIGNRILLNLHNHVASSKPKIFWIRARAFRHAAAIFIGVLFVSAYFLLRHTNKALGFETLNASAPTNHTENKFVTLPDSSTVLLHPGSHIHFVMNGKEREVNLSGEAYFEVKHDGKHPFAVYTGDVKTTVLGTAFNIKAYPGKSVTVSVTRGKVSVTNRIKNITKFLLPNNQVVYNKTDKSLKAAKVDSRTSISWVKADVQFINIPFKNLIECLDRRYDVQISFKNLKLATCLITGRFNGTESLQQVLQVISETMGTTFTINGSAVELDGQACN